MAVLIAPKIALCGSMDFVAEMRAARLALEKRGFQVFVPEDPDLASQPELLEKYLQLSKTEQRQIRLGLIQAHLDKIRLADAILVVNATKGEVAGYIGANTLIEMAFAYVLNKKIYVLNPIGSQKNQDEAEALAEVVLEGDLARLE